MTEAAACPETLMVTGPATSGALKVVVNHPPDPVFTGEVTEPAETDSWIEAFSTSQRELSKAAPMIPLVSPAKMSGAALKALI
jgi:hypothetical protein